MLTVATFVIRQMLTLSTFSSDPPILFNSQVTHDRHSKTYDRPDAGTILSVPHRYADQSTSQNFKNGGRFSERCLGSCRSCINTPTLALSAAIFGSAEPRSPFNTGNRSRRLPAMQNGLT